MQTLLISFTVLSSVVAAAMCAIVIRMLREERRRSDARVEALLAMAGEPRHADAVEASRTPRAAAAPWSTAEPQAAVDGVRTEHAVAEVSEDALQLATFLDVEPHDGGTTLRGTPDQGTRTDEPTTMDNRDQGTVLFALPDTASPWSRRIAAAAALALIVLVGALAFGGRDSGRDVVTAAGTEVATAQAPPIELLSLSHAADSGALTITGVVQNPRGGRAIAEISAVALLLDRSGRTIATGSAPLDFRRLEAGAESPFVVKVPVSGRVDRYRIGFRDARGAVVAHVDRRNAGPIARRD